MKLNARGLYAATVVAACVCAVSSARAASPHIGYIYPSGIQAGTTNRVIVGGQYMWGVREALLSGPGGLHVTEVEAVPGFPNPTGDQRRYLTKWLAQIAEGNREQPPLPVDNEHFNEWRSNRWWSVLGTLDAQKIAIVEDNLFTPRNPLQMSPSIGQKMLVTIVADRDAKPGVREFRLIGPGGISEPKPFVVTTAPRQEEPLYRAPMRRLKDPPTVERIPSVLDGQIRPGSTDVWRLPPLKKGRVLTFRAMAREFQPYIGDAVPGFFNPELRIVNAAGREVAFASDYFYHPDPVLTFTVPADGDYRLEIHDTLYRGRADFVYSVHISEGPAKPPVRSLSLAPLPRYTVPGYSMVTQFMGVVKAPGEVCQHKFRVKKGGKYVFDILARRVGSPLDARVCVEDETGNTVATFSDVTNTVHVGTVIQAECDPVGTVALAPGKYVAKVVDEAGKGGGAYFYTLRIHRPAPRFEVWANCSGFAVRPWGRVNMPVEVIRRDGFDGEIRIEENDFFKFKPNVIPAESNSVVIAAISKRRTPCPATNITVWASSVKKPQLRTTVSPANKYNQAFAWDHYVPAGSFVFRGFPAPPPKKPQPKKSQPPAAAAAKPAAPAKAANPAMPQPKPGK
ncbi:MAG: hypothetical protein IJ146_14535 [Kiritimatiellae bacterium]|nr:hypothetical protein [Kiritimatiellia bacterium]